MNTIALLVTAVSLASGHAGAPCTPGMTKLAGEPARVFCGSAQATARVAGRRYRFTGGVCATSFGGFSVNIGTKVFGRPKSAPPYFGLLVESMRSGAHRGGSVLVGFSQGPFAVSLAAQGGTARTDTTVVLAPDLRSGSFSGEDLSGRRVTGSFTC
ncbi:MAG TPA: hypothetical protein VGF23_06640 [Gaiellaceae bacterium]|jgi:hypothetical protein